MMLKLHACALISFGCTNIVLYTLPSETETMLKRGTACANARATLINTVKATQRRMKGPKMNNQSTSTYSHCDNQIARLCGLYCIYKSQDDGFFICYPLQRLHHILTKIEFRFKTRHKELSVTEMVIEIRREWFAQN